MKSSVLITLAIALLGAGWARADSSVAPLRLLDRTSAPVTAFSGSTITFSALVTGKPGSVVPVHSRWLQKSANILAPLPETLPISVSVPAAGVVLTTISVPSPHVERTSTFELLLSTEGSLGVPLPGITIVLRPTTLLDELQRWSLTHRLSVSPDCPALESLLTRLAARYAVLQSGDIAEKAELSLECEDRRSKDRNPSIVLQTTDDEIIVIEALEQSVRLLIPARLTTDDGAYQDALMRAARLALRHDTNQELL